MKRAYKYRLYPTKEAERNITTWLRLCCDLYNGCIEHRRDCYYRMGWGRLKWKERPRIKSDNPRKNSKPQSPYTNQGITLYEQQLELKPLKEVCPEFAEIGSQVLKDVCGRVEHAYKIFWAALKRGEKSSPPEYKKYHEYLSLTFPNSSAWKMEKRITENGRLTGDMTFTVEDKSKKKAFRVGDFKIRTKRSQPISGDIKTVTIRKEKTGEWYIIFSCDNVDQVSLPKTQKKVGIDLGLLSFCVDTDGTVVNNPRFFEQMQGRLRRYQRKAARQRKAWEERNPNHHPKEKAKGKNLDKTFHLIRTQHAKTARCRKDFIRKLAAYYVQNYDVINIEQLNVKAMIRSAARNKKGNVAKWLNDTGWAMFLDSLSHAAEKAGKTVEFVDPSYSNRRCSNCGHEQAEPTRAKRFKCEKCKKVTDRVVNAAINILDSNGEVSAADKEIIADRLNAKRELLFEDGRFVLEYSEQGPQDVVSMLKRIREKYA